MYQIKLLLISVSFVLTQCRPQNFSPIISSDLPENFDQRFELLKIASQQNDQIKPKRLRSAENNIDNLITNPLFAELLAELNQRVLEKQRGQTTTTTTTTTTPLPNFANFAQNNPFLHQQATQKPLRILTTPVSSPNNVFPSNPFLNQQPSTTLVELRNESPRPRRISTSTTTTPIESQFSLLSRISPAVQAPSLLATQASEETEIPENIQPNPDILTSNVPKVSRPSTEDKFNEEIFKKQAETAKYQFATDIDDTINGNLHQRQEIRDGLTVRGKYTYSDGFFKRTVHYEADEKGYRVVSEEVEPIGNGPQINPKGHAKVASYVDGNAIQYEITQADIQERKRTGLPAISNRADNGGRTKTQ